MDLDQRIKDRHKLLLTTISDNIGDSGPEFDNFVEHMKGYVPRGVLASKKTLLLKFDALATRGHLKPGNYDVLKKICQLSGNIDIKNLVEEAERDINLLQGTKESNNSQARNREPTTIYSRSLVQNTTGDYPPSAKRQRTGTDNQDRSDDLYTKDERNRGFYDSTNKTGLLLILNSTENRRGTEIDVQRLHEFFEEKLHFSVYDPRAYENEDLTTEMIDQVLDEVRQQLNSVLGKRYYCFVCVILSHGDEKGIKTKDGIKSIDDIREGFNNKHISNFTGRPKVFLIQACRGLEQQSSVPIDHPDDEIVPANVKTREQDESDEIIEVPTDADTLLAFATTLGYKSFRRVAIGSWFITECIRVFTEYHMYDHLEDMLITVRERVALNWAKNDGAKQMPCVWSTLTKRLMLKGSETPS